MLFDPRHFARAAVPIRTARLVRGPNGFRPGSTYLLHIVESVSPHSIHLDGVAWDLSAIPAQNSVTSFQQSAARSAVLAQLGSSGLLGLAALSCCSTYVEAKTMLTSAFSMPPARATAALKLGARLLDRRQKNHPLGYLAGVKLSDSRAQEVLSICKAPTKDDGPSAKRSCLAATHQRWLRGDIQAIVRPAAMSNDLPTMSVTAALLASMQPTAKSGIARPLNDSLTLSMAQPTAAKARDRRSDRILSAAYVLSTLRASAIDLGDTQWTGASAGWRFRAAPWLLPILDPYDNGAIRELLDAAVMLGLDFVPVGSPPFLYDLEKVVIDQVTHRAQVEAAQLTKWPDRPMWFDGGAAGAQVLLTEDDEHAYAWVGRNKRGLLVAFDTDHFVGYGIDEPGTRSALSMAIGWFIDVTKTLRTTPTGTASVSRTGGSKKAGYRYVPTTTFVQHSKNVAKGVNAPPRPHVVDAHIRHYKPGGYRPSEEARKRAPARLRRRMKKHDTYVRSYATGAGATIVELDKHLAKYSALADVLGDLKSSP